jgi:hypothetical protein
MAQVSSVVSPLGSSLNSAVLWLSNGLKKSSLIVTLDGGVGDLHAALARLAVAVPFVHGALALVGAAERSLHRGIQFLVGRPGAPAVEIGDERKDPVRRCLDAGRALDPERVGFGNGEQQHPGHRNDQQNDDDDGDGLDH